MPCKKWTCSTCGPAKVHQLTALAVAARPERFVTLSRVAPDLKITYRRLQTLSKALRRRDYTWEYLAVPERHQNGFWHLHILQRGDFIPQRVLSERAESAGMGRVVHIRKVSEGDQAARYLSKYLAKSMRDESFRNMNRYRASRGFWPGGLQAHRDHVFGESSGDWNVVGRTPRHLGKCS